MKKLYIFFAVVFSVFLLGSLNSQAMGLLESPKQPIALFIQMDPSHVGKPLETSEEIYTKVNEKLKSVGYEAIDFTKAQTDLKVYIRDNDTNDNQRDQDKGVILRTKDLKALAAKEGTRYVMVLATRVTSAEEKENFWTGLRKNLTIMTSVTIYDTQKEDYIMDEELSSVGKTSGSYDRAFHRAIEDTLTKIDLGQYLK